MNNSLFTQTFTRLKPVKYLASLVLLARLKNSASLSALILATLLVACGGGGGGGGGAANPPTTVTNFNVVPALDRMTLSWTNPNRADIASINLSWAAYAANDLSRDTAGDGYVMLNHSAAVATAADNSHNIVVGATALNGIPISGNRLTKVNAYVFSLQLSFTGGATAAAKIPDITAPRVPRSLGANPDGDSFADTQVYSVDSPLATSDGGNVTLRWTNPQVGAGNIASIRVSYANNNSATGSVTLRDTAYTATDGSATTYIWTGLEPGLYNFTIAPTLGGIFAGIEVAPGMARTGVSPPAAANQITPTVTTDPVGAITDVFPDDGDVQYILTITQQDDVANPMLSVLSSITGTCSIDPDGLRTLTYDADNQTSATYNVTGTAAGGACEISFQVIEDRRSVTLSRSISFNPELPPSLRADVMGGQTSQINVPAQLNVTLVINATKQDNSNTRDVTFPASVESSSTPSCTATLIGSAADMPRQYDGIIAGATTAATYNVSSTGMVPVADCGTFDFDVTEGSATVTNLLTLPSISFGEATNKNLAPTVTTDPVGAITDAFPDDGAVSYNLTITKRDILLNPILNTTASTTGTCSIAPTDVTPLTYDGDDEANTIYTIDFNGTTTAGGTCNAIFVVTEDGEATTITRSIIFKPELGPTLDAVLLGNATGVSENVLADEDVRVNVTATKQDGGKNPTITFPASVVSSACTATLAGDITRQYSVAIAGTSAVTVTYNVRPLNPAVATTCGSFTFTATEGPATGMITPQFSGPISFVIDETDTDSDGVFDFIDNCPMMANPDQSNLDGDDEGDACDDDIDGDSTLNAADVDDDGDGLIELSTAEQLNMMRYNLDGTSLKASAVATGDSMGCGGGRHANGTAIDACNGYEQMADLDLNDLPKDAAAGSNWQPVGSCGSGSNCGAAEGVQLFTGVFSGNGFTISNLLIHITTTSYGVGFFGAISPTAEIRNVHIRGGNITRTEITSQYVGGIVGYSDGGAISNSSVTLAEISGTVRVGGLVGSGSEVTISSSVATVGSISGDFNVGGLVGDGPSATISFSVATVGSVISNSLYAGGLVGRGTDATISFSVATVGSVISNSLYVGGLVGSGNSVTISSSVATIGSISAVNQVGGLVGDGRSATISSSVATVGSISGAQEVGGLVGLGTDATISFSVATVDSIMSVDISLWPSNYVGGLVGYGFNATINSSVAVTNSITGAAHVGGLVGASGTVRSTNSDPSNVTASYWDSKVSFANAIMNATTNTFGSAQTTSALQGPITFGGIYANWGGAYCNPNTGAYSATAPDTIGDFIRVWDLGTSSQYPAITCARNLFPLAEQRDATARVIAGESPLVD